MVINRKCAKVLLETASSWIIVKMKIMFVLFSRIIAV